MKYAQNLIHKLIQEKREIPRNKRINRLMSKGAKLFLIVVAAIFVQFIYLIAIKYLFSWSPKHYRATDTGYKIVSYTNAGTFAFA